MAGKDKYAEQMAKHLGEAIDAACPITRPGGTAAQIGGTLGGVVGAAVASGRPSSAPRASDVAIGQFGWLGLGPSGFALTNASFTGKPKGDPLATIAYADVTAISLTEGKITVRIDLDVSDGRHIAFESKTQGQNRAGKEVVELLAARCGGGG